MLHSANRADAIAAMKVWCDIVGRNRGFLLDSSIEVIDSFNTLERRIQDGTGDVLIMESTDYFKVEPLRVLSPVFFSRRRKDAPLDDHVLLVHRDSGITSLEQLRGKTAAFYSRTAANYGRLWMDVMLDDHKLGPARQFFKTTTDVSKPSAAVLPVFFKTTDACVTDRVGFELAKELNPQVGARLNLLTNSPKFLESVVCLHNNFQEIRPDFLRACAELHTEPRGQQVLFVFKSDQLLPFQSEYLEAVRALWKRHERLLSVPAGGAGSARVSAMQP